jgi:hypothetical protein
VAVAEEAHEEGLGGARVRIPGAAQRHRTGDGREAGVGREVAGGETPVAARVRQIYCEFSSIQDQDLDVRTQ